MVANNYWDNRYIGGGNSGIGSYGEFAQHKADVVNNYIKKYNINSISDFGCGDGNQISMLSGFGTYCGFDVSTYIINECKKRFNHVSSMKFINNINDMPEADLCLSLDVLYHIIDIKDFEDQLNLLFTKANKFVLIYSSNQDVNSLNAPHVCHRKFTVWIENFYDNFELVETISNELETSAKFYLYQRKL